MKKTAKKVPAKSGLWIKASGTTVPVKPQKGTKFELKELQKMVGGWVERLQLPDQTVMLANEEGIPLQLPPNAHASSLSGRNIYGDVVVLPRGMGW